MTPTLSLGPWDAPEFEFRPSSINPILVILTERFDPMGRADADQLLSFLQLDTIFLKRETISFFLKFELVCRNIVSGEWGTYDVHKFQLSPYAAYLKWGPGNGVVSEEVKAAARDYLNFLGEHRQHWPPVNK